MNQYKIKTYTYLSKIFSFLPTDLIHIISKFVGKKLPLYRYNFRIVRFRGSRRDKYYNKHFNRRKLNY